jgi:pyruvate kinase
VKPGERVIIDDGRIVAVVETKGRDGLRCRVTSLVKASLRLRSAKGIAFPDSDLALDALGQADEEALVFGLELADTVDVSFVHTSTNRRQGPAELSEAGFLDSSLSFKTAADGQPFVICYGGQAPFIPPAPDMRWGTDLRGTWTRALGERAAEG